MTSHPAIEAWTATRVSTGNVQTVITNDVPAPEILKPEHRKSSVYRLQGVGPDGENVIAKRCRREVAVLEETIYREVLSKFSREFPRLYGTSSDEDEQFAWLFIEDVGDVSFVPSNQDHREAAARCVGFLHRHPLPPGVAARLPEWGQAHLLEILVDAHKVLRIGLDNHLIVNDDRAVLESLADACTYLTSRPALISKLCSALPRALVHGDLGAKNVRMVVRNGSLCFVPFDWETSGWGCPAIDLSAVDIATYWDEISGAGVTRSFADVEFAWRLGRIFWSVAPIRGESASLGGTWPEPAMTKVRFYGSQVAEAMAAIE